MIKPEDIPNSMVWVMFGETLTPETIAGLLNEAIEAGIVSPPCWVARTASGELVRGAVYTSKDDAERNKWTSDPVEHWKGQVE
jgi:hypothetical protein